MPRQLLRWSRHPEVQAEIDRLSPASSNDFRQWVNSIGTGGARAPRPETLVFALREAMQGGYSDLVEQLAVVIYQVVRARADGYARQFGLDSDDLTHELFVRALPEWLDVSEEFWEVNFGHMLTLAKYEAAKAIRPVARMNAEVSLTRSEEEEEQRDLAIPAADVALEGVPMRIDVSVAMRELPEPIRTAVFLKFWEKWPESSTDPGRVSIAKHLGVTDRTIRNYLRTGIGLLRASLKETDQ